MNKSVEALANKDDEKVDARWLDPRAANKQGFHLKVQILDSLCLPVHAYQSKIATDKATTNEPSKKGEKLTRVF